jgi:hypothetical protein
MAHKAQFDYVQKVKSLHPSYFSNSVVYDFGSLDINGNTGIDIGEGKNVDVISKAHEYKPRKKADVVISTEMLEHDMYWKESMANMVKRLKKDGLLVITCATHGRPVHGTSSTKGTDSPFTSQIEGWANYYKNLGTEDFMEALDPSKNFSKWEISLEEEHKDIQFYGIKV